MMYSLTYYICWRKQLILLRMLTQLLHYVTNNGEWLYNAWILLYEWRYNNLKHDFVSNAIGFTYNLEAMNMRCHYFPIILHLNDPSRIIGLHIIITIKWNILVELYVGNFANSLLKKLVFNFNI